VATRIYTNASGAVGVTPTTWLFGTQLNPVTVPGTLTLNTGSTMTTWSDLSGAGNPTTRATGRTIIGPLAAQTISGTVKGQMRGMESHANTNATLAMGIKLVQPDGTDRATLLPVRTPTAWAGSELVVDVLTNAQFKANDGTTPLPLTSQTATAGDYLVIEWGFRSNVDQNRTVTLSYGNDSASALPEDATETQAFAPWWEFSADLVFVSGPMVANTLQLTETPTLSVTAPPPLTLPSVSLLHGTETVVSRLISHPAPTTVTTLSELATVSVALLPLVTTMVHLLEAVDVTQASATPTLTLTPAGTLRLADHPTVVLVSPPGSSNLAYVFVEALTVTIPPATHHLDSPDVVLTVYDTQTPRHRQTPGAVTTDLTTGAITLTFLQPTSGTVVLAGAAPGTPAQAPVAQAFSVTESPYTVTVPGATHGLPTPHLHVEVYDDSTPRQRLTAGQVTVEVETADVVITLSQATSGTVVLSAYANAPGVPLPALAFSTSGTPPTATILGSSHGIPSASLLLAVYDDSTPRRAIEPGGVTVHPTTFDVTLTFLQPTSGTVVLSGLLSTVAPEVVSALVLSDEGTVTLLTQASATTTVLLTDQVVIAQRETWHPTAVVTAQMTETVTLDVVTTPLVTALLHATDLATVRLGLQVPLRSATTMLTDVVTVLTGVQRQVTDVLAVSASVQVAPTLVLTPAVTVGLTERLTGTVTPLRILTTSTVALTETVDLVRVTAAPLPNLGVAFSALTEPYVVTIPASTSHLTTPAVLVSVYGTGTPRPRLTPGSVTVDPTTYEVVVTFLQPTSGTVVLAGAAPADSATAHVAVPFSVAEVPYTVTILGTTHGLPTPNMHVEVADSTSPPARVQPASVTIDASTADVTLTFLQPTSGTVVLGGYAREGPAPLVAAAFSVTEAPYTVTLPQALHGIASEALLLQVYDDGTPRQRLTPGRVTVDPVSHTVVVQFLGPASGTIVLSGFGVAAGIYVEDPVTLTEGVQVHLPVLAPAMTATVALTASVQVVPTLPVALTAAVGLTDAPVLCVTPLLVSAAETLALLETVVVVRGIEGIWQPLVTTPVALTEQVQITVPWLAVTTSTGLVLQDVPSLTSTLTCAVTSVASLTEGTGVAPTLVVSASGLVALTEQRSVERMAVPLWQVSVTDTLLEHDTPTVAPTLPVSVVTTLALTEVPSVLRGIEGVWQVQVSTTAQLTETVAASQPFLAPVTATTLALTEVQTLTSTLARAVSTTLALVDTLTPLLPLLPLTATTTVLLTPVVSLRLPLLPLTATQPLTVSDMVSVVRGIEGVWQTLTSSTLVVSDSVTVHVPVLAPVATSLLGMTELVSMTRTVAQGVTTGVTLTDIPVLVLPLLPLTTATTLTLTASVSLVPTPLRPHPTQAVTVSEQVTVLRGIEGLWQATTSTTAALTEVVTLHVPRLAPVVSTTLVLTEVRTLTGTLRRAVTSALTLTETRVLRVPRLPLATSTAVTTGDVVTLRLPLLHASLTQLLAVTDIPTVVRGIEGVWQMLVSTTVSLTEQVSLRLSTSASTSATLQLTEGVTLTSTLPMRATVTVVFTETVTMASLLHQTASEAVALTEVPVLRLPWVVAQATDTASLVPEVTLVFPWLLASTTTSLTLDDTCTVYKLAERTVALQVPGPTLAMHETVALVMQTQSVTSEAMSLTDTVGVSLLLTPTVSETLTATEVRTVGVAITVSMSEALHLTAVLTLHRQVQPHRISGGALTLTRGHGTEDGLTRSAVLAETLL
jgi:hypothetical protein